ncbi:GDP-D-glucose phosphorylase 1 [Venturia canescens]|uniref:GDP-D-glucose phosphorylase 1 n=1 Tax=Venturia canescens TaxID=32260 RepID=UPI001C9CEB3D|nr:GDP-D-glucose phosphorylase 1 [Venturia canescens]
MTEERKMLTYRYVPAVHFHYTVKNHENPSEFDNILGEKWEEAEEHGVFRYKLRIKSKILPGRYKFLAQLNCERGTKRRPPESIESMSQPFHRDRFNFTKLNASEILLNIEDETTGNYEIAVNASPIEYAHCLFLPNRMACLPQIITEASLFKVLDLLLLSNSPYLRIIFNSLGAHASVNHLHWHLYYLKYEMLLEHIELQGLEGPLFALENYPAKGFCFKLSSFVDRDVKSFASWAYFLINYLQQNEIPHNVYITRAKTDRQDEYYDDIRIYIWARKASFGIKNTEIFIPAVSELFGHLIIRSKDDFENLTEETVVPLFNDVTGETFDATKKEIVDKIATKIGAKS